MTELTSQNFEQEVMSSPGLVLVDFYADWCRPCSVLAEMLEQLSESSPESVKFGKLDVERNDDITARFRIQSLPTLVFFKNGEEIRRMVGLTAKNELQSLVSHFASCC